jgi:hypothetical protein
MPPLFAHRSVSAVVVAPRFPWLLWLLGLLAGVLLLPACSSFEADRPPLPDSTMTAVLTEMHLASERYTITRSVPPGLRDSIFARFSVDPEDYEATLQYYSRHPEAFEGLYNAVVDSLNAARSSIRSGRTPYPQPGDAQDRSYGDGQ